MTTLGDGIAVAGSALAVAVVLVTLIVCRTILTLRGFTFADEDNDKDEEKKS